MATVLIPGSFDPLHLGHIDVVDQAVELFGDVVVGVLVNFEKPSGLFTADERVGLAQESLARLEQRFPKEIAHTVVGYHVKIDEAQSSGLSIFEYAPRDRGAAVMAELAEELELRQQIDSADPRQRPPSPGVQP